MVRIKDGNGPLIPDSLWGIPLLGDEDGANFSPMGIQMVGKQSLSRLVGTGMGIHPPNPIPANPPRLEHVEVSQSHASGPFKSAHEGPAAVQVYIQNLTLIPRLPSLLVHLNHSHNR